LWKFSTYNDSEDDEEEEDYDSDEDDDDDDDDSPASQVLDAPSAAVSDVLFVKLQICIIVKFGFVVVQIVGTKLFTIGGYQADLALIDISKASITKALAGHLFVDTNVSILKISK
jgi:hypothetical protein